MQKKIDEITESEQKPEGTIQSATIGWDGTKFGYSPIESSLDLSNVITPAGVSKDQLKIIIQAGINVQKENKDKDPNITICSFRESELCKPLETSQDIDEINDIMDRESNDKTQALNFHCRHYRGYLRKSALTLIHYSFNHKHIFEVAYLCFLVL